jgi:hypothetical protein
MQDQVAHMVQILFNHPKKDIQLMEILLPVSMIFQLLIGMKFYSIDMNRRNLETQYSPLNLSNHLNWCRVIPTSMSKVYVGKFQQ